MDRNYIQELGLLAIASRLKNLSDLLVRDLTIIYKESDIGFEPRWFTFVHLLNKEGQLSITEIAARLNQTHPAVNQVANVLEKENLVISSKDSNDSRKRLIRLSKKGSKLVNDIQPVWDAVEKTVANLISESGSSLFTELEKVEEHLAKKSIYDRIKSQIRSDLLEGIEIIKYRPIYKSYFIDLNLAWLEKYFTVEPHDKQLLFNPEEEIIGKGGEILLIKYREKIIGTSALLHVNATVCELTKMAIKENMQGYGIGRKLLEAMIKLAQSNGYEKMTLLTSIRLEYAVRLYKSVGFTESHETSLLLQNLKRPSIQMELNL